MEAPLLLNKKHLAEMFGVTTRCIEKWIASGTLPRPRHIGRFPYWERETFLDWVRAEFSVIPPVVQKTRQGRPRKHWESTEPGKAVVRRIASA